MSKRSRCKFRVSSVTLLMNAEEVILRPEYDPNDPEDTRFSAATPSGKMEIMISNPALLGMFKPGQFYYLDLTPVE